MWAQLQRKEEQKVGLRPVGRMYCVGSFLANVHYCLRPNQTARYFELNTHKLPTYLATFARLRQLEDELLLRGGRHGRGQTET